MRGTVRSLRPSLLSAARRPPGSRPRQRRRRTRAAAAATLVGGLLASACAGAGGGGDGDVLTVLMVNNPEMQQLQQLTEDHFTTRTGIEVHFTMLPENDVRDTISQDFATQSGQYDIATISNYETPIYAGNGWLHPLDDHIAEDEEYDGADVLEPIRLSLTDDAGGTYAQPFYGESSMLMYREDVFAELGLEMPEQPTWQEVADLAAQVDEARPDMRGICLRGLPGWGELIAPLSTVVNTFGGTWFDEDWNARLTAPEFVEATEFYVNLLREHGPAGAAQAGYAECLNNMVQGNTAMWYDATAGAGSLEEDGSPVQGDIGYVPAPVERTESAGWLFTWAWAIQAASDNPDTAWEFISWASGKEYEELVGAELGWANVPAGKRASTYDNPEYQAAAESFYHVTHDAIREADPESPGVQPRPAPGIQFVGIPEFTDLGLRVSQEISSAIAGQQSVETALANSQELAEQVGEVYQNR